MSLFKRCPHRGRARDDCPHPWWSALIINGTRHQISLEKHFQRQVRGRGSKTLARALELQLRDALRTTPATPSDAGAGDKTRTLFRDFVVEYKAQYVDLKGLRSWENDRRYKVARYVEEWGDLPVSAITLDHITRFHAAKKRAGCTPATIKRWYAPLHHMLGWAEARDYIERTPLKKGAIPLESEDNDRTRRPSVDELTAIRQAADPLMRDMIDMALATGLRQGTIRKLQGQHLDWTPRPKSPYGLLKVPGRQLKNGKLFVAPIPAEVHAILRRRFEALGERRDAYLFGNEVGELVSSKHVWNLWDKTLRNAGLKTATHDPDLHFHDLRAEYASRLVEAGTSLDKIRKLLGHSTLLMTQRYLRARLGDGFEDFYDGDGQPTGPARESTTESTTPLRLVKGRAVR